MVCITAGFRTVRPKKRNHFNGNMYVLTAGPTFSAASIVCNIVRPQNNITLVGEETGGGWYGNSGIFIPDITLPNTKIKVRLPLFKMVQYQHVATKGTGVLPEFFVPTDYNAILNNYDKKMQVAYQLIQANKKSK
jgi:C-terminal processing protease CtpA/Prc